MLVTTFLFLGVTGVVRHVGSDLPNIEASFIRYAIGLLLILPWAGALWKTKISRKSWGLYAFRGFFHAIGVSLWFYAMARIPIAEVTAIGYISPIFVTIGAAMFLGEKLHWRRIGAVVAAFVGAIIILRPGFQELNSGQLAQLCAALFSRHPSFWPSDSRTIPIRGPSSSCCRCSVRWPFCRGAIWQWRDPTWEEVGWMALTAAFATAGHWTLTQAFKCAPITVTQPVGFLQLVWATILGMTVFGEPLDPICAGRWRRDRCVGHLHLASRGAGRTSASTRHRCRL